MLQFSLRYLLFLCLLLCGITLRAQTVSVTGRVVDAETKSPLAFVSIVIEGQTKGTGTDIDGKFIITSPTPFSSINLSCLGYEPLRYDVSSNSNVLIKMKRKGIELGEVEILPGENPAHRIIKKVIENREMNNPERVRSFTYTSYNKMYVTADLASADSISPTDTTKNGLNSFLQKQHLFMSESVTQRQYLEGMNHELVIATRTSGIKESPFAFLATQMQSFSFYKEMIMVLDKNYLGPVSDGSYNKYLFILEDTLYQGNDSVYVISFRPRKGKTFEALKGTLYINTNGYALQNVIAEPVDNSGMLAGKIQQKYEFIDNKQWFPVQLNTDWFYNLFDLGDTTISMSMKGRAAKFDPNNKMKVVCRSYISEIVINPGLKKRDFSNVELEIDADVSNKSEAFWYKYRGDSLSLKEQRTYQVIDSIGKASKLDLKMRTYEALAFGKYPVGKFDLDLNRIYTHNEYEGERLGAGLHTSDRISKWFSVGGYAAYSFKGENFNYKGTGFKYGGDAELTFDRKNEVKLSGSYMNDVTESGGVKFWEDKKLLSSESFRNYRIEVMDKIEKKEASFSFRAMKYWAFNLSGNTQTRTSTNQYMFGIPSEDTQLTNTFRFTEAGLGFRFSYREKFLKTPRYKTSMGSDYPVVYGQVTRGFKGVMDGQFDYTRYDLKIESTFLLREYGKTSILLNAGMIDGDLPYTMLYNGKGSYERYAISYGNTNFGTMRMNEFLSDRYASLFFSHNLGALLLQSKKFHPELVLVTNIGYGSLRHPDHHFNIPIRTMEKGYFESGLLVNNLLRTQMLGFGVGTLYRYGPYALPEPKDNAAVKFTFTVNF